MRAHFLILLLLLSPVLNRAGSDKALPEAESLSRLYNELDLPGKGLDITVFKLAMEGKHKLGQEGRLKNNSILTIVDFSQSSRNRRLYVIDLEHKKLLFNTFVAHGRNSGEEYASKFSNRSGSYMSSLGFYITRQEAVGPNVGLSLVLEGVEKGINDRALERGIIIHGADYATEQFIRNTGRLGRSFGCPSLPPEETKPVIGTIKDGSCLFIYYPDQDYLRQSVFFCHKQESAQTGL